MASMNLLGFSLSPQEHPSTQDQTVVASRFGFNPHDHGISDVQGDCFDLPSDSSTHSFNQLPPFALYQEEPFHRNTNINTTQG